MHKKRLLALAVMQLAGAHAVAQTAHPITLWRSVDQGMQPPYPPEVERRAQRAAWSRSKKTRETEMTAHTEQERAAALAEKHGASSYRNRADTAHPAFGFTPATLAALIADVEQAARLAQVVERTPLSADDIKEPKNGEAWRVEWWNESLRMMLPSGKVLHRFTAYRNGTLQFTLKARDHRITQEQQG